MSAIKKAKLTLTASTLHQVVVEMQSSIPGGRRGRQPGTADEAWHRRRRAGGGGDRRWTPPSQAPAPHFDSTQNPCTSKQNWSNSAFSSSFFKFKAASVYTEPHWDLSVWQNKKTKATKHTNVYLMKTKLFFFFLINWTQKCESCLIYPSYGHVKSKLTEIIHFVTGVKLWYDFMFAIFSFLQKKKKNQSKKEKRISKKGHPDKPWWVSDEWYFSGIFVFLSSFLPFSCFSLNSADRGQRANVVSRYLSVPCKPEPNLLSPLPEELVVYR